MKIIPLTSLVVSKRQRSAMAPKPLDELVDSILRVGLLHPPVAWERPDGKWELTVGERRLQAVRKIADELKKNFIHGGIQIAIGMIPITPLGEYLDEIGRFEAELDENLRREAISWQDETQAYADLHKLRQAQNPAQTFTQTGKELAERRGAENPEASTHRIVVSNAVTLAEHLDDPAIAKARNANEAMNLVLLKEEKKITAELIRRQLAAATEKPKLEVRHGDLTTTLPGLACEPFDLIIADPPYGIDAGAAGFRARTVHHHNYEDTPAAARTITECILTEGFRLTRQRANIFCFGAIETFEWWKRTAANLGWVPFNRPLIWAKSDSEGLAPWGSIGPRITTEFIFYATKGQRGLNSSPIDVFRVNRVPRNERLHAAEKPVELLSQLIKCATLPGERVLDPCCGSGSTLVACREIQRFAMGIEKEETYYNLALTNAHGASDGGTV